MKRLIICILALVASSAWADEIVTVGAIDVCHDVFVSDSASTTGAGKTGIAYSAVTCKYKRCNQASPTTMTLVDGTVGTQLDNSWKEIANGWYQICPPDAAYASGRCSAIWCYGAADMAPMNLRVVLQADAITTLNAIQTAVGSGGSTAYYKR